MNHPRFPSRAAPCCALGCALLALAVMAGAFARPMETPEILSRPASEVERQLPESHPASYLIYASRLWSEGHQNDAVFWFYVGQLRYRFHLAAHPELEPGGDPALFSSLLASIGPPINRHAGTSLPNWKKQIARALQWDEANPNLFTSKQAFAAAWQQTRAGLVKFSADLDRQVATPRPPAANLPAPVSPSSALHPAPAAPPLTPMPAAWPALEPHTNAAMLAGSYEAGFSSLLGPIFFPTAEGRVNRALSFELSVADDRHLRVRALRDEKVLAEKLLEITPEPDAVVFTDVARDREAGIALGDVTRRQHLRLNVAGDLVVQRDIHLTPPPATGPAAPKYTLWRIAKRLPPAAPVVPNPNSSPP